MQRIRRVAGLGEGKRLRKSIDLALRHPATDFVAVEKAHADELTHFSYLKERGAKLKPNNLTIRAGITAEKYLTGEKANSFDHLYAHFLGQHLSFAARQELFRQAWRTLKPGTRFAIIDAWAYEKPFMMELRNAGFSVNAKKITAEELLKLGTDNADINAIKAINAREMFEILKTMPTAQLTNLIAHATEGKGTTIKDMKRLNQQEVRDIHTAFFTKYNGPNPSQEAKNANKLVTRTVRGEAHFKKPFVVITATKGRVRHA